MERKIGPDGKEVLFLDVFQLVHLCGTGFDFCFAIRGDYPLDEEGREAFKEGLNLEAALYFEQTYETDISELIADSRVVFSGTFPQHKQEELARDFADKNVVLIDTGNPDLAEYLDWHHGAIFIPTYE